MLDPEIEKRIRVWLDGPYDETTKAEIRKLMQSDPKALSDAFFKDISFGTAGMRGTMGIGTNRMNVYTIRSATQGLANYLKQKNKKNKVFIGYDTRNHSREFALETARVFSGNGFEVLLSHEICPTPLVSFCCRHFNCTASVMITASHNPPEYNGYKVYWSDGCQVVPPHDTAIMAEVKKIKNLDQILLGDTWTELGPELDQLYLDQLKNYQHLTDHPPLKIIYSNLHGTGIRLVPKALASWGFPNISYVEKQKPLDGNFPAAHSPNPEDDKAMQLGMDQLAQEKADVFIATDPDADRIGVVVLDQGRDQGRPIRLTGNQSACICLYHICTHKKPFPLNAACIKTIVTTELFKAIADHFKIQCLDVLTGFKYIGEQIHKWEKPNSPQFIFGAEESYGFLFNPFVRDKDAVSASCLVAEATAAAKKKNLTLAGLLHHLYQQFGVYRETISNLAFSDTPEGMKQMQGLMEKLRKNPPTTVGNQKVEKMEDYLKGFQGLPPSDVLRFWLSDGSKLVIRPSGTEPKVKIYVEVKEKITKDMDQTIASCDQRLKVLVEDFLKQTK